MPTVPEGAPEVFTAGVWSPNNRVPQQHQAFGCRQLRRVSRLDVRFVQKYRKVIGGSPAQRRAVAPIGTAQRRLRGHNDDYRLSGFHLHDNERIGAEGVRRAHSVGRMQRTRTAGCGRMRPPAAQQGPFSSLPRALMTGRFKFRQFFVTSPFL